jgi:hypothetical protein
MKNKLVAISAAFAVAVLGTLTIPAPALAAGSVIDIGLTIYSGGVVKGSGSMTNNGDWDNVCLVIMAKQYGSSQGYADMTIKCKTNTGYAIWSPPDFSPGICIDTYTRITAYKNHVSKANKDSNKIRVNC